MGDLLKFPVGESKFGYKRVRRRKAADQPGQLELFPQSEAPILSFAAPTSAFERALQLDEQGDSRAAEWYAKAITDEDCVADAYCNLGIIESKQGHSAKAFDCFTTALKHRPRHGEAHYNLGNLYFELNDLHLAQVHYEMAVEVDPSFANVYFNLALVQSIQNDLASAIHTLTRYRELVPEDEARNTDELLRNLQQSLAAMREPRTGSH